MGPALRRDHGIAVPVRAFGLANTRLAEALDPETRLPLARALATRVVEAAGDVPIAVVTSAPEVAAWARDRGCSVVPDPGTLDAAAHAGVVALRDLGCARAVVAHADLPFVTTFAPVVDDAIANTVVLVPCHRDDGTPVLSLPTDALGRFGFSYGSGSFTRHVDAARAGGLTVRIVRDPSLAFDVDTVDDLAVLVQHDPTLLGTRTIREPPS
jgi:2-phospho-L-lactate guanylyltransferase